MTYVSGIEPKNMAYIMMLAGAGMVVGNLLGGILTDKLDAPRTAAILMFAMALALSVVFFFSQNTVLSIVMVFICGGLSMSSSSPLNILSMKAAPGSEMMAAAFMQAAFNIANSAGAFFGGIPLEKGYNYNYPSLVGVGMVLLGFMITLLYIRKYAPKKNVSEKTSLS